MAEADPRPGAPHPGAPSPGAAPARPARAVPARARPDQCVEAMGYAVYNEDLSLIPLSRPCSTIQTISPISYGNAIRDPLHRRAMQEADWLCLDGVYFGLASLVLKRRTTKPNQGPDIFYHFLARLQETKGRVFFLGASPATLEKITARMACDYPEVAVASYSPPFKPEFSEDDNEAMIAAINAFRPDVVFLGMTAPKQEKWAHAHRDRLDAAIVASVGGVFDWYAGNRPEIHPFWWKIYMAWLIRTIDRPELLRRYPKIALFFWHLMLAAVGIRRYPGND
ncbi:WecB/TagA/CpsF family glycosyltransferase [Erythrobacter sp. HL-111]|uniref:WecB/TagA/CpsF family glycosyltransferase n=1 Tax=Erythrobacter sp. HL-111 TaxID=1798193 RepID=UPI0006DB0B1E|nr:WecB/TagA/CpsF family glycosyltransferase [Erythrobacter sp. HL-111]KPP95481.1 MAG: N-acetylglucosaminyldiphosphoundecaprenol N-acetyl-beta-D-mannosaminyltransferase TagA [Erythrobacteraceae bacterium HL-111]SDS72613.1 N-acetylglucosaminyldiphosphoundecaprenol N-acetyl-beta-D-mannosaminyltransferase [Erythrobacter sp. HL-111]